MLIEGSPTVYRWLLDQEDFLIDFDQQDDDARSIASALIEGGQEWHISSCLETVIARVSDLDSLAERNVWGVVISLAHVAIISLPYVANDHDFPKRIKVLWDAGADFHTPRPHNLFGTTLDSLFDCVALAIYRLYNEDRVGSNYRVFEVKRDSIPAPPLMSAEDVVHYDQLEETSAIEFRPRTPKSLWPTWYPGNDLSVLELAQRHLDAWMEVLLDAGIDIAEYGRREDQMHPEGLFHSGFADAYVHFEYGDHVSGCRIHVTEIWMCDPRRVFRWEKPVSESSAMPGSWDFDGD